LLVALDIVFVVAGCSRLSALCAPRLSMALDVSFVIAGCSRLSALCAPRLSVALDIVVVRCLLLDAFAAHRAPNAAISLGFVLAHL